MRSRLPLLLHLRPQGAPRRLAAAAAAAAALLVASGCTGTDMSTTTSAVVAARVVTLIDDRAVATGRYVSARMQLEDDPITFPVDGGAVLPIALESVWSQQAYLKASNTQAGDYFGYRIAVSGDTVVVGTPDESSNAIGVDGDGTNDSASVSGAAHVFVRSGGTWTQQAYLKASNAAVGDRFGWSVAISGDTIVVGAIYEDSGARGVNGDGTSDAAPQSGAAYVFTRTAGVWSQQAYLKASNTGAEDYFGAAVAVSGDTIVVGAFYEDSGATDVDGDASDDGTTNAGAAYVFARSGTTWSQQAYLKASDTGIGDHFGHSVATSGDTVVVGAHFEDSSVTGVDGDATDDSASGSGAAYVFARSGTTWSQQAYLKASNTGAGDRFGFSVATSGDTIVVGAPLEDGASTGVDGDQTSDSTTNAGAAYAFVRSAGVWTQQAYLKASNTDAGDEFGYSVAIASDTVVVGARDEDSSATGVDGDASSAGAEDSGAAYVFARVGAAWSPQAYLKASNTGEGDQLGWSVAVSAGTVVASAYLEDGSAAVVDGPDDDAATYAGAAYVWMRTPVAPAAPAASEAPSITCGPEAPRAGATLTCTISGAPAAFDLLWRAAHNPVFAEGVLTTGTDGTGMIAFTVPDGAAGDVLTVELVAWTGPVAMGTIADARVAGSDAAGGPIPTRIDAGLGPGLGATHGLLAGALLAVAALALLIGAGIALRRPARSTRHL